MGRPPCCEKVGIKKGPWTPEEDIILVSYIQQHGPGNWRSVPTNTGLVRCSKSCRLRWTNYLRPGIKRGNFTPHEEGIIIHLQALLGNKWAAIASYLPQRTDNDIKNYWNTHLKKKIHKFHPCCSSSSNNNNSASSAPALAPAPPASSDPHHPSKHIAFTTLHKRDSSMDDINVYTNQQASTTSSSTNTNRSLTHKSTYNDMHSNYYNKPHFWNSNTTTKVVYASSTENISRLLQGWMNNSNSSTSSSTKTQLTTLTNTTKTKASASAYYNYSTTFIHNDGSSNENKQGIDFMSNEEFESILSMDNLNSHGNIANDDCDHDDDDDDDDDDDMEADEENGGGDDDHVLHHSKQVIRPVHDGSTINNNNSNTRGPPLSFLENWLFDEASTGQVEDMMELPPIF